MQYPSLTNIAYITTTFSILMAYQIKNPGFSPAMPLSSEAQILMTFGAKEEA